jgi:hypothetical protein
LTTPSAAWGFATANPFPAQGVDRRIESFSDDLNALAFTGGAFDAARWARITFGCFVPAAISGATYILARLTRRETSSAT